MNATETVVPAARYRLREFHAFETNGTHFVYLVPSGAIVRKPSLRNIPGVPNQRHSGTAAIFGEATGYASTTPPPLFPIEASAARRANFATPRPRYFGSTKKHVIRHSFLTSTGGATLR